MSALETLAGLNITVDEELAGPHLGIRLNWLKNTG